MPFIFQLPESFRRANPDAFLPQQIALGLYNSKNNLQSYKRRMAKKALQELYLPDQFAQLCDQLKPLELRIRACYDTHLEISGDNWASILLVDALFLLRLFLNISNAMENFGSSLKLPLPNLDAQFLILNDVLKLENQIPLLVFKAILPAPLNVKFPVFLYHFCKSVSPFALNDYNHDQNFGAILDQSHHLLHFMYFSILIFPEVQLPYVLQAGQFTVSPTFLQHCSSILRSVLNIDFILELNNVIGFIRELLEVIGMVRKQSSTHHKTTSSDPVIPSASQLQKFNFQFIHIQGILHTKFFKEPTFPTAGWTPITHSRKNPFKLIATQLSATLNLPVITVNAFTETLFENLLAFEAMANINPPVFARYLDLMKALIPTSKDLNILKDAKIIHNHLDNDEEVVNLFKRVGNSISSLKQPTTKNSFKKSESKSKKETFETINKKYEKGLKRIVEEINQFYQSFWIVKVKKYVKKFVSCLVKMFAILVLIFNIFRGVKNLVVTSNIGNDDQPNYQIPAT